MADTTKKKIDIEVAASYTGSSTLGLAAKDIQKLREQANLPIMGPLTRTQAKAEGQVYEENLVKEMVGARIRAMEAAADRARIGSKANEILFGGGESASRRPDVYGLAGDAYDLKPAGNRSMEDQATRDARARELRRARNAIPTGAGMSGYGSDVTRLRGGLSAGGAAGREQEESLKSLSQQSGELQRAFKLFGAVAIATHFGQALSKIPEVADKFRENLKAGYTRTEAYATAIADAIPGIGDLAKGIRAFRQFVDDELISSRGAEARERERKQDDRDMRDKMGDAIKAKRDPILRGGLELAQGARDRQQLVGTLGVTRESTQAWVDYEQAVRKVDETLKDIGALAPEQQDRLRGQGAYAKQVAAAERDEKLTEIQKKFNSQILTDEAEHISKITELDGAARQEQLQRDQRFFTAKVEAVKAAAKAETEAIAREEEKAAQDPNRDATRDAERFKARREGVQRRVREQEATIGAEGQRSLDDAEREYGKKVSDFLLSEQDREAEKQRRFYAGPQSPDFSPGSRLLRGISGISNPGPLNGGSDPNERAARAAEQSRVELGKMFKELKLLRADLKASPVVRSAEN